LHGEDVKE